MASLIDDGPFDGSPGNTPEFTVSELSGAVRRMVEGEFGHVRVRGEIGRVSRPRSGHVYLDLKDERAVLAGVVWKGVANGLATQPEEGMEVVVTGRMTTFPGQSRYQIVIETLAPAGMGALMAMLEKRKRQLAAQGLFDEGRKRMLPYMPAVVGVVTSPSGAVIRDILHRFRDRFPVRVLVWPVAVQGERCAPDVSAAISGFSTLPSKGPIPRPDVIIVARGGGSVEDLWGFNEEIVVRATAASTIPVISAIGHETDTTLIDYAADRRAPTPTAAAEIAVPVRGELAAVLADYQARRIRALHSLLQRRGQRLKDLSRALPRPEQILADRRQRLDVASARLPAPGLLLKDRRRRLEIALARRPSPTSMLRAARLQVAGLRLPPAAALTRQPRKDLRRAASGLAPALRVQSGRTRLRLAQIVSGFSANVLRQRLSHQADTLMRTSLRLPSGPARAARHAQDKLSALSRMLQSLSYQGTLARGYAVVRDSGDRVRPRADGLAPRSEVTIEFHDGRISAITGPSTVPSKGAARSRRTRAAQSGKSDDGQGSLF